MPRKKLLKLDDVLAALERLMAIEGKAPTIEELRQDLGVGSKRTVLRYLKKLEEDGAIRRWSGARGIQLLRRSGSGISTTAIPVVGEAPAGPLMLAEENLGAWLRLPSSILRPASSKFFLLRVRGNSMDQARVEGGLIESGDLVLVRRESVAEPGQIVVALVDGEATIKRLRKGEDYWVLEPQSSDPSNRPIILTEDFRIQGVVVRVIKKGAEILEA